MTYLERRSDGRLEKLVDWFKSKGGPVVVAFSGGVDSSLTLAAAVKALGSNNVYAVTVQSPLHPSEELEVARRVASALGVDHIIVTVDVLGVEDFSNNPPNRCYICKKSIATKLKDVAVKVGAKNIIDGTNFEDLNDYRPGYAAFKEEGVLSPLAELGFTKNDVRELAKTLGLPNWDKPSTACLASRIPYGQKITVERLERIEKAEKIVRKLTGARSVRVRDHGDIARVEVGRDERKLFFSLELMDSLVNELKLLGWRYVTLDLEGYRSGSMDETLKEKHLSKLGSKLEKL